MKRTVALLGALAALATIVVGLSSAPAGAGTQTLGDLDVTPAVSNVGTTVTVTPLAPCPQGSNQALITYSNPDGTTADSASLTLDEELGWIDSVIPDAGQYRVSVECVGPPAGAAHRAARGIAQQTYGTYNEGSFQVNGIVTGSPNPATVGGNVTLSVAAPSACQPVGNFPAGVVTLTVNDPDNVAVVTNATPTVAAGGTFSLVVVASKAGTYTVTGTCDRTFTPQPPSAGHLSVAQVASFTDDFDYSGSVTVSAAPTTTTAAPASGVAAEAVVANPTFTG
jgi:hypothetical protein